eukprot:5739839-Pyramimonas_sp.AAC.1
MEPDRPNEISDTSVQLERWSALAEKLDKRGNSYELPLPFKITALKLIMAHAGEWFDDGQQY